MNAKDNTCELAVRYLGRISLALVIGVTLCFLAVIGYNTYISVTQEKIEVQTTNSNLINNV